MSLAFVRLTAGSEPQTEEPQTRGTGVFPTRSWLMKLSLSSPSPRASFDSESEVGEITRSIACSQLSFNYFNLQIAMSRYHLAFQLKGSLAQLKTNLKVPNFLSHQRVRLDVRSLYKASRCNPNSTKLMTLVLGLLV